MLAWRFRRSSSAASIVTVSSLRLDAISSLPRIETFLKVFNKNVAPRVGGGEQLAREMIGI